MDERSQRRDNSVRTRAEISGRPLAETNEATQGVEQKNEEQHDGKESYRVQQWKEDSSRDKSERCEPCRPSRLARHLVERLPGQLAKRLALRQRIVESGRQRIPVSGRRSTGTFDGVSDLMKALAFPPERAAGVAECRVSEQAGLIHLFNAAHDPGPQ
jgi:hypothetical protein